MSGFIASAVKVIDFCLINEANATFKTLSPKLCWIVLGTIVVLIPERVRVPDSVQFAMVDCDLFQLFPCCTCVSQVLVSTRLPDQLSFQLFQTVPKLRSMIPALFNSVIVSNGPGKSMSISGCLSVSIHSSISGSKTNSPTYGIVS